MAFGLQLLRVWIAELFYYLHEVVEAADATLVLIALVVFGATFLAALVWRVGGGRALWLVAGGVALARLLGQVAASPAANVIIASFGVILFLLFLPISLGHLRSIGANRHFPTSILLGLSIDTVLKGAFGTIDLAWLPGLLPITIVAILIALQVGLLRGLCVERSQASATSLRLAWPLLALGPFLFLQTQLFQNVGLVATVANWSPPVALEFIILWNGLGMLLAGSLFGRLPRRAWTWAIVVGLILIVVTLPLEGDPLVGLELFAGQAAASIGLAIISEDRSQVRQAEVKEQKGHVADGLKNTPIVVGLSLFVLLGLLLGYYLGQAFLLPIAAWMFAPIAALIILVAMVGAVRARDPASTDRVDLTAGVISFGLVIVPLVALIGWREPEPVTGSYPVRLVSYNLHSGFDVNGRPDLEAIAQTIESEKPDIVGLQEVSRGWVLDSSVDMLSWLSQRLDMPYVWGPTADPMWGNAILSRYPVMSVQYGAMPNNAIVRPMRGYIVATIDVGGQPLHVITTHLHHVGADCALRIPQVQAILDAWNHQPRTAILGDFNAQPDSTEMTLMRQAGLLDSFSAAGASDGGDADTPDHPDRRIDYIFVTPDLIPTNFHVNLSTASDHSAIAVTIDVK